MSKITNDGLSWSGTGCFIAVPIWQQWALEGSVTGLRHSAVIETCDDTGMSDERETCGSAEAEMKCDIMVLSASSSVRRLQFLPSRRVPSTNSSETTSPSPCHARRRQRATPRANRRYDQPISCLRAIPRPRDVIARQLLALRHIGRRA